MEAGGAQKALLVLAQGLKQHGHHVLVASMYDKDEYISIFNRQYNLEIIDLQMKPPGNKLIKAKAFITGLHRLRQIMRSEQIDVLQSFSHYSNLVGPAIAWVSGVSVRVSSQRMSLRGAPGWLRFLDRTVANSRLVQMMTAVSEGTRLFSIQEQGIRPDKMITIPNGVDLARYHHPLSTAEAVQLRQALGLEITDVIVLTVARLHPQKGHRYLLQAAPGIRQIIPNVHFLFVGEGQLEEQLIAQIKEDKLENCVHLLGVRQDIAQLLAISDLFVLPSLWEGLPNAVLEAMAAGVPVVATNVDGCPEVIVDGETGFLVPPKEPQLLQKAVLEILQNDSLSIAMSQAARQYAVEHFSVESNISNYLSLYEQLLSG
jgi:glycosyltransferase involved in cell wall biosynthesis